MVDSAEAITGAGWQVLHVTGAKSEVSDPGVADYRMIEYADRMDLALAIADAAVSRAGAATVSELSALGIPAVYVPYPVGNGEQRFNAAGVVAAGGGILVEDAAFLPEWVGREVVSLIADRDRLERMSRAAASVGALDGTDRMVALVDGALRGGGAPAPRARNVDHTDPTRRKHRDIVTIKPDLSTVIPADLGAVHFVGIGGSGMSGIARLALDAGHRVTGSDVRDSANVEALRALGATVSIGHAAENLPDDVDTVVVTGALWLDNPEYRLALSRGIPVLHRSQALASVIAGRRLVSVAGAHGKTTSTGMIITGLLGLGEDPSFVNGGVIEELGVSSAAGEGSCSSSRPTSRTVRSCCTTRRSR
ncbi:hypothetical protein GCM10025870_03830 [Agromyces marinus]|uniref:UDP-N-acetylmuramate--L-alanine ligase n=1 Tax=Agromyces marinus TaxID=1389020 RepID=A0ABN6YBK9_9MICO|nr:hypothetical protein GCM10025870_03830 [Agromyces marinus]